jgi:iron complex outermembrane recepter protein
MNRRVRSLQTSVNSRFPRLLVVSLALSLSAGAVATAQDASKQPAPLPAPEIRKDVASAGETKRLAPIVVTGSLIPTAETVGPAQVTTVTAADIEKTSPGSVLEIVKKLDPSFSGNGNIGQTLNNGGFGEANVQIRNLPTLVLLNGRRLGNSAFSNGAYVDLNTIPLAAVERIEVLKDGASALYGSDAIGGVVNIITKKDFNGVDLDGYIGGATQKGNYYQTRASVVAGVSTDHGQFTFAAQYYHSDPLFTPDRKIAGLDVDPLLNKGLSASENYFSPSFPGKVQDSGGTWYLNQSVYQSPPVFAGQSFTTVAAYNAYATGPGGLSVAPYGTTPPDFAAPYGLLNTTKFGTISVQSQDRRNLFGDGTYDLIGKEVQLYTTILYSSLQSDGELAPSPVLGLAPYQANINVPFNNQYNPFGIDLGPGYANGLPPATPRIRSRFWDSGNRIFDSNTDYYHVVAGLKGEFEAGYTYDVGYTYNQYDQLQTTENAINGAALALALQPNIDPVLAGAGLSQLRTAAGGFAPQYDLFSYPGQNSPTTLAAIRTSLFEKGRATDWAASGQITGSPFELKAGKVGFAIGGGIGSASLAVDFDGLTRLGLVPGLNTTLPTSGTRDEYDLFAEVHLPLASPDNNLPILRSLEVTAAGRFESFKPGGDNIVPKVAVRWQPLDEQVTLRASYSQSFIAPTTYQLFGGAAESNPNITDANGTTAQESVAFVNNSSLRAQTSENYGGGIVITPKAIKGLTVSVDYYHLTVRNGIFQLDAQSIVNDLNAKGSDSAYRDLWTFSNGSKLTSNVKSQIVDLTWGLLDIPWANGSRTEAEGLDFSATYERPTESLGKFTFYANANLTLNYTYGDPVIGGPFHYDGQYTDLQVVGGAQGTLPDYQITTGVTWEFRDFTCTVNSRYIPPVIDKGDGFPLDNANSYTGSGKNWKVDSWFDIDMQVSYQIGRNAAQGSLLGGTRLTLGVNNITDEAPPLISSSSEDNTDKATYDIIGRFVYFEVSKKF